jgi:hypothetical protein
MDWSQDEETVELIAKLTDIKNRGWVRCKRPSHQQGKVGNTLEDLFGIKENNLPSPNGGKWEYKAQGVNKNTKSYLTFLHHEPYPREQLVEKIFVPLYGWPLKNHPNEMSFRVTMSGNKYTNRGFKIDVDRVKEKISVDFNSNEVKKAEKELNWLADVEKKVGLGKIVPQPHWTFNTLKRILIKCQNIVYVAASQKKVDDAEYFHYNQTWFLHGLIFEKFIDALENGIILVDFDARSGYNRGPHNHGVKIRIDHKGRGDKVKIAMDNCARFFQEVERVI